MNASDPTAGCSLTGGLLEVLRVFLFLMVVEKPTDEEKKGMAAACLNEISHSVLDLVIVNTLPPSCHSMNIRHGLP